MRGPVNTGYIEDTLSQFCKLSVGFLEINFIYLFRSNKIINNMHNIANILNELTTHIFVVILKNKSNVSLQEKMQP